MGALGGLDVLVNNASSLGPVPLVPLADTDCEDLELALATNLVGPFRLTKALLGSLAASAREGRRPLVVNVSSDAAVTAYPGWGAYGASKAALHHLSRIWSEELASEGIRIVSVDPGDMDTPLHALAVPDADRSTLKSPDAAAREIADLIAASCARRDGSVRLAGAARSFSDSSQHGDAAASRTRRLLVIDERGAITHRARADFQTLVRAGDVVVANDAATLPASLAGVHRADRWRRGSAARGTRFAAAP